MERWWGTCVVIRITAPTPAVGSFSDQVLLDLPRRASSTSAFHILLESRVCLRRSRRELKILHWHQTPGDGIAVGL